MVKNITFILIVFSLAILTYGQTNQWVKVDSSSTGGVLAAPVYAASANGFIYWGFRAATSASSPDYDVQKFNAATGLWSNEYGVPPQPQVTRYPTETNFPYYLEFALSSGKLRPVPPCPNRPGWLAYQACYVPDSGKVFYYWGEKTFTYDPIAQKFDSIKTDTAGKFINTPPCLSLGTLTWDPINHEVVLFGGGYLPHGGKGFDPDWDPSATWVFSFSTRQWRKLAATPLLFQNAFAVLDSFRRIERRLWADAGQHYMQHAEINPTNTQTLLASRTADLAASLTAYGSTLSQGIGYVRQQTDSAAACLNRAALYLSQSSTQITASQFSDAYLGTLDSAQSQIVRAMDYMRTSPEPRYYSRMVYAGNGKIMLFGGTGDKTSLFDTWVYDCATRSWEHRYPLTYPKGLIGGISCMDYDSRNEVCVLVDGNGNVWTYSVSANQWKKWNIPALASNLREWNDFNFLDYDSVNGIHVMTSTNDGNNNGANPRMTLTLKLDLSSASEVSVTSNAAPAYRSTVWPSFRASLSNRQNVTAWKTFIDTMPKNKIVDITGYMPYLCTERAYGTGTYDTDRDQLILWGGGHSAYMGSEVSQYDITTNRWYESYAPDYPAPPFGAPDGDGWNNFSGNPGSAHSYAYLGYDSRFSKVMLGTRYFNPDTREWESGRDYTGIPGGVPSIITSANKSLGAVGFRGYHSTHPYIGVYIMSDTASKIWREYPARLNGTTTEQFKGAYDTHRNRVIFYGVKSGSNTRYDETWAFSLTDSSWKQLNPAVYDLAGAVQTTSIMPDKGTWNIAYDTLNDAVGMFGAMGDGGDFWLYDCKANFWRKVGAFSGTSGTLSVGYSLKRQMFVMCYYRSHHWGTDPTGIAYFKYDPSLLTPLATEAESQPDNLKDGLACSPNPFNPELRIIYKVSKPSEVTLSIYNINGRTIATMPQGKVDAGQHSIVLNGKKLSSGVYTIRMQMAGKTFIKSVMLVR
ncbi:MAG: T9SS type A sorting domain-containing protein [Fibrobacteres bacterium]|nr:T9SS type A sorting domain-containing protein [Fibrobacterota bacterium]